MLIGHQGSTREVVSSSLSTKSKRQAWQNHSWSSSIWVICANTMEPCWRRNRTVPFLKSQALTTGVRISEFYTVFKTIRVHICLFSIGCSWRPQRGIRCTLVALSGPSYDGKDGPRPKKDAPHTSLGQIHFLSTGFSSQRPHPGCLVSCWWRFIASPSPVENGQPL